MRKREVAVKMWRNSVIFMAICIAVFFIASLTVDGFFKTICIIFGIVASFIELEVVLNKEDFLDYHTKEYDK